MTPHHDEVYTLLHHRNRWLEDSDNSTSTETDQVDDGETLLNAIIIYGSIYVVALFIFCTVRRHHPQTFQVRHVNPKYKCELAKEQYGWISWMYQLAIINEDDLMEQCGMDGLCFLRVLTFGSKVALVGILNSVWLFPIYATASEDDDSDVSYDGLSKLSATSVAPSDPRLIATAIAAWIVFGFTMKLILSELEWFTRKRHLHLAKTQPRNYTAYVAHIPYELRTSAALLHYFQNCFGKDAVLEAHVAMDIPQLDKLVGQRTSVLSKLEHAVNVQHIKRVEPMHKVNGEKVKSIEAYTEELRQLNQDITDSIVKILAKQDPMVLRKREEEEKQKLLSSSSIGGDDGIDNNSIMMSSSVMGVSRISEAESQMNQSLISSIADESAYGNLQAQTEEQSQPPKTTGSMFLNSKVAQDPQDDGPMDSQPQDTTDEDGLVSVDSSNEEDEDEEEEIVKKRGFALVTNKVSGVTNLGATGLKNMTDKAVSLLTTEEDGATRESGFVTFTKLTATHAARQLVHHPKPFCLKTSEAPMPHDIIWTFVGKNHQQVQSGMLISLAATGALCLFWTIPVAFLSSLTEVDALRENIGFIDDMLNEAPWMEQVLAQVAPLLIVGLNAILPYILLAITMFELPISKSIAEASTMIKLSIFMVIQTFFVSAISGSLFQAVDSFVNDPWSAVDVIASALPQQAIYFTQILLVATSLGQTVELLNIPRVCVSKIRSWIGPTLTEKEANSVWMGLICLIEPWQLMYAFIMGKGVLFYMVTFVYSAMTPIVNYFLFLCFVLLNIGWRHQLIYIYPVLKDSGGKLFTGFIAVNITCMIIAEFVLLGWFGIKKAPVSAGLMAPLIIVTLIFQFYIKQQHFRVADHLPTSECVEADYKNMPLDYSFVKNKFRQPSLLATDEVPENCQDIFYRDAAADMEFSPDEENQGLLEDNNGEKSVT